MPSVSKVTVYPTLLKCEILFVMTNLPEWAIAGLLFIIVTVLAIVAYFLKKRDDTIDAGYTKLSEKIDNLLAKFSEISIGTTLLSYRMGKVEEETKKLETTIENQDKVMDGINQKLELLMKYKPLLDKLLKEDGNS